MRGSCSIPEAAPAWAPEWVFCPSEKILSVVVAWLVGGIETAGLWVTRAIATPYDVLTEALVVAGTSIMRAGGSVQTAVLQVVFGVNNTILDLATTAGPLAPVVTTAYFTVVVLLALLALLALVRAIRKVRIWVV